MENNYSDILVGHEDKRKIFIEYGEYLKILKFAKAGALEGSRGVLFGYKTNEDTYITKVIEAVYSGDEGLEGPIFSPQSWGRISAEIKNFKNELLLLGQFSTHPSVKPIRIDYVMQEKYFPKSADILFVFNPTDNEEKFYLYDDREFVFVNGFYIYDKFQIPVDLKLRENVLRPLSREYEIRMRIFDDIKKKIRKQNNIYAIISAMLVVLLAYVLINFYSLENRVEYYSLSGRERIEWKNE